MRNVDLKEQIAPNAVVPRYASFHAPRGRYISTQNLSKKGRCERERYKTMYLVTERNNLMWERNQLATSFENRT